MSVPGSAAWASATSIGPLMTQELGYYAIPDSLSDTAYVAAMLLRRLGADQPLAARWLPRIAEGSARHRARPPGQPLVADAPPRTRTPRAGDRPGACLARADAGHGVGRFALPSIDGSRRLAALSYAKPRHAGAGGDRTPGCGMKRWTAPPSTWPASRPGAAHARPVGRLCRSASSSAR